MSHASLSDTTLSIRTANIIGAAALPVAFAPVPLHAALWGWESFHLRLIVAAALFVPATILGVLLHEGLHALGFILLGGAPRKRIRFGIDRETLSPFAGCSAPMGIGAYRASVALPALVLGGVPLAAGLAAGLGWLTAWGCWMLALAGGDAAALWAARRVPAGARVLDHPGRVGCRVVAT